METEKKVVELQSTEAENILDNIHTCFMKSFIDSVTRYQRLYTPTPYNELPEEMKAEIFNEYKRNFLTLCCTYVLDLGENHITKIED